MLKLRCRRSCHNANENLRNNGFIRFACSLSASQIRGQEMMWVREYLRVSSISSTSEPNCASFQPFQCHPHVLTEISLVYGERTYTPNLVLFPIQVPTKAFSNCLSHSNPGKGCPHRFRSRGTTGSSIFSHDCGHLCRGRCVQTSGHSDFGLLSNFGASSNFYLNLNRYCISCLSFTTWRSCNNVHNLCSSHL